MPQVVFKPTISVFERAKRVHALDRTATVNGFTDLHSVKSQKIEIFITTAVITLDHTKYSTFHGSCNMEITDKFVPVMQ
jgi:hypothetical protein